MAIRQLRPETVNRIAAGEVIEAGAAEIEVVAAGGGAAVVRVTDDGSGMSPDDLVLSVERHTTSKLADDDISDIRTLGFRGEALPSIGSGARPPPQSRAHGPRAGLQILL